MFQWSDEEEKSNNYASFNFIKSVQTWFVSVNMADGSYAGLLRGSRVEHRAQQDALDNIQHLFEQLLTNQNPNANHEGTSGSNHQEEEDPKEDTPKDEQPHPNETSSIDIEVIKGIQA